MKTMCPHGYHHNGFVATHALGHMIIIKIRNISMVITTYIIIIIVVTIVIIVVIMIISTAIMIFKVL